MQSFWKWEVAFFIFILIVLKYNKEYLKTIVLISLQDMRWVLKNLNVIRDIIIVIF